ERLELLDPLHGKEEDVRVVERDHDDVAGEEERAHHVDGAAAALLQVVLEAPVAEEPEPPLSATVAIGDLLRGFARRAREPRVRVCDADREGEARDGRPGGGSAAARRPRGATAGAGRPDHRRRPAAEPRAATP